MLDLWVGLLFVDFDKGGLLQISGLVTIRWHDDSYEGVRRSIEIDVQRVVELNSVLPFQWSSPVGAGNGMAPLLSMLHSLVVAFLTKLQSLLTERGVDTDCIHVEQF